MEWDVEHEQAPVMNVKKRGWKEPVRVELHMKGDELAALWIGSIKLTKQELEVIFYLKDTGKIK